MKTWRVLFALAMVFVAGMASAQQPIPIGNLPPASLPISPNDLAVVGQANILRRATVSQLLAGSSFAAQNPNTVFAGPVSGVPAAPSFRALTGADLPSGAVYTVGDTVALQALPTTIAALTNNVRVGTYRLPVGNTPGIFSPPVDYFLTATACTPDGGSCFSAQGGKFWHITPQTIWDARWWGAYEDIVDVLGPTTVNANSCSIAFGLVAGQPFTNFAASNVGSSITITDGVAGGTNGLSYIGTIAAVSNAQQISVSAPCPTFTSLSTQNQHVAYGHDDAGPWNNAIAYVNSLVSAGAGGQPVLSGGGRSTGFASAAITFSANAKLENVDFIALGYASLGFTCATTNAFCTLPQGTSTNIGFNIASSFSTGENVIVDANYLPINPCFTRANGTIRWSNLRCKNEQGSISSVSISGASTTTAASINGTLSNCVATSGPVEPYYCTFTVNSVGSGTVQPGQALTGTSIPNGTYVSQFGADNFSGAGSGGAGQYTVVNFQSVLSNVGAEAMTTLGLDVTVAACNQTNFTQLFNPTGLVYHNNANFSGILDRTFIVGCANSTTMVLNKAPTRAFSGQTLVFNQDSNGFLAIGNAGLQVNLLTVSNDDAGYFGVISNHYGCGQLMDGSGGSGFTTPSIAYSAANVCEGPDAQNNQWRGLVAVGVADSGTIELNSPAFLAMDGAQNTTLSDIGFGGQVQFFLLNAGSNTQTSILQNQPFSQASQTIYAPNNTYWFYTEIANASTGLMNLDFPYRNSNTPNPTGMTGGSPYVVDFTTGGSGAWQQYTPTQIARLSRSMNPFIPPSAGTPQLPVQPMQTLGADFNTAPLTASEDCLETFAASATLHESDTGCTIFISGGSGTITITLGSDVGVNSSAAYFAGVFKLPSIIAHTTQTVQLVLAAGSLFEGGTPTSGTVTLTNNVPYSIRCPANVGGTDPFCFLSTGLGSVNNVALNSGPLTTAQVAVFGFNRISRPATVISADFSAINFTCSGNPVIDLLECGTSTTCGAPTVLASVTLTAANTGTTGTLIGTPTITAGDLIAAEIISGTCSAINVNVAAELQQN